MTPAEMVEFLMARVGHEKSGATAEVRRYITGTPLYQVGYLLGGWQFLALQKELVGSGRMSEQQFHDAVLKANCLPIELLRAGLLGLPLSRHSGPTWKFAVVPARP